MKTKKKRRLKPEKLKCKTHNRKHEDSALKSKEEIVARIRKLTESLCEAEGFELVHVEYQWEAGGNILRLYIDKPDVYQLDAHQLGGVTLDDCAYISRQVSDLLDVDLSESGLDDNMPYRLEVSSPGHDRPLEKNLTLKDSKKEQ